MRSLDLTPLFRSTVGFDHLSRALDAAFRLDDSALSYPPYNIEKHSDNVYRITMAVAGFSEADLEIVVSGGALVVRGRASPEAENTTYLHRGIAGRAFERRFQLAETIRVTGASLLNGLLRIDLMHEVPEVKKPRTIRIETGGTGTGPVEAGAPDRVEPERQAA